MAYSHKNSKGTEYFLHGKVVELKGGRKQQIHYFKKEVDAPFALDAIPEGRMVSENPRTGLPLLKKSVEAGTADAGAKKAAPKKG